MEIRLKTKVLVFAGYYIPSVKGGGPIQSIKNLVDNLSDVFDFYIVASDRDLGDQYPFKIVAINEWIECGNAKVLYVDKSKLTIRDTIHLIKTSSCNVIYLNSFFSFRDGIIPILLNKLKYIPTKKIVLAPRGQFSKGALSLQARACACGRQWLPEPCMTSSRLPRRWRANPGERD